MRKRQQGSEIKKRRDWKVSGEKDLTILLISSIKVFLGDLCVYVILFREAFKKKKKKV